MHRNSVYSATHWLGKLPVRKHNRKHFYNNDGGLALKLSIPSCVKSFYTIPGQKRINLALLWTVFSVLTACETLPAKDPAFAPTRAVEKPRAYNNGSIYMASYDMRLFEDQIARRIGDLLTVRFNEKTQAKKDADIDVSKNTDITVEAPTLWGVASQTILGNSMETRVKANRKADGEGKANQSNTFTGDISVTVYDVLPNGNLLVRGEKRMTLNQGSEYIRISGIVRTIDIDAGNVVPSSKVADATIMYTGDGAVADASKLGWFNRILNHWLFPF